MDIMLERMLSLIPKKDDGSFVHGEKKKFCLTIGAPTNIVSEWIAGKTRSYRGYVSTVAEKYNVSVAWLMGETDNPKVHSEESQALSSDTGVTVGYTAATQKKPTQEGELNPLYYSLTDENRAMVDALIAKLLKSQSAD